MPLTIGSTDAFQINCPCCRSEFWTWEALAIPYSISWINELDALARTMDSFEPTRIIAKKGRAMEEL
jgi:hypothetical protein